MFSGWCQKNKEKRNGIFCNIEIVRWNDNSIVIIRINAYGVQLTGIAKRWIERKGKQNIPLPAIIAAYNPGMNGVDLLDHELIGLSPVIRGKKWY